MVVRFSDAELVVVRERAALNGLAVGAWIGQTVSTSRAGRRPPLGLPDLVRLHADVVGLERAALAGGVAAAQVAHLLARLDVAVDAVVAEFERRRR